MPIDHKSELTNESSWQPVFLRILEQGDSAAREKVLDFISMQTDLSADDAGRFLPILQRLLLDSEPRLRYFSRKACNAFDKWLNVADPRLNEPGTPENGNNLTTKEILLRKMRLGSRYVAFDAMERLTESGDLTLADPLIQFITSEQDTFKISYLVKRIGRISDQRIPALVESFLDHPDPRVVANALESLWDLGTPHLAAKFKTMAESTDNRIRANAVRALFKYAPEEAEKSIETMLTSRNPAWQDSAVFLLQALRTAQHEKFRDIALNSSFAGIRLRALDIPILGSSGTPPATTTTEQRGEKKRHLLGLVFSLVFAGIFNFYFTPRSIAFSLFMGIPGLITLILVRNRNPFFARIALSLLFLAIGDSDRHSLLIIPILMIIWTGSGDPAGIISTKGGFFAGLFVLSSLLLANLEFSRYLQLSQGLEHLSGFLGKSRPLLAILVSHKRSFFAGMFAIISLGTLATAGIDRWSPTDNEPSRLKRQLLIPAIGLLLILACHLAYNLSVAAVLATNGLTQPQTIVKFLSD
jgi:HEAT repeat protein